MVVACRRVQELAAERQRAAEAERALEEGRGAAQAEVAHLQAELVAAREQLLAGVADEDLVAHLQEFAALREVLLDTMDDQEAELQALREQVLPAYNDRRQATGAEIDKMCLEC